ncbi:MAG TPA: DegT/DnrJ/EryC1/StrS family aminotransferase [Beijerinckiaceae bacterium]|jgi:CDP-6-deoxy-D-xylo-4-hexulose-3-dehydrase
MVTRLAKHSEDGIEWRAARPSQTANETLFSSIRAGVTAYCAATQNYAFDAQNPVVRLHEPTFGAEEINAALECLLTTHVTMGDKVRGFEEAFAEAYGWQHGVMNNSGSSANLLAIAALANHATHDGLRAGDEVIVPALSWSTTVWPLIQLGLKPVIVDIDPQTLNIDPAEIERAIGPKTRAVMTVPVYGNPCDMDAITEICERRDLILIEDCCEALGAYYGGTPVGRFGRVATFSFYYSHHMTTLEGGITVTDDFELAELLRILRAHGWTREVKDKVRWHDRYPEFDKRFLFVNLGYNLRPTELAGAMGLVQLPKLADFVRIRRENAAWFAAELKRFAELFSFQEEHPKGESSWFGFPLILKQSTPFNTAELTAHLNAAGIETRPIICGNIARQPALQHYEHRTVGTLNNANRVMDRAFSFGNHQAIDAAARSHVVERIGAFLRERGLA